MIVRTVNNSKAALGRKVNAAARRATVRRAGCAGLAHVAEADGIQPLCGLMGGLSPYRKGMDYGIDAFIYHLNHGTGVIDETNLRWMQERFNVANESLARTCRH